MFTTYEVKDGDTFEKISCKVYGYGDKSGLIKQANPDVAEPLTAGSELLVAVNNPPTQCLKPSESNQVSLVIDDISVSFWESVTINRSMDSIDTISFSAPFERDLPGFTDVFRPFEFKPLSAFVGEELLFNGTQISVNPVIEPNRKLIEVSGYSIPGVLNDCTAPITAYPLEFNFQTLNTIAEKICEPFNIKVSFDAEVGAKFERVACNPGKKLLPFLIDLARQRGLVLTNDSAGDLIFWQSVKPGLPVAKLIQGESPLISITANFSPQNYYSHISGVDFIIVGYTGSIYTVRNKKLKTLRPFTFKTPDSLDSSVKNAVEAKAGRMFASMASYTISVSTWRDSFGNLWEPNTTLVLKAPDAMIYNEYEFIIRSVELVRESDNEIANIELILPGAFEAKLPESLPWDS